MKGWIGGLILGIVAGAAAMWFLKPGGLGPAHGEAEKPVAGEEHEASRLVHTNDQTFIRLDSETQQRMALKVAELQGVTMPNEMRAYGRVLDPAPLAALAIEIASAQAALDASHREYQRLKTLHGERQNVSARALETAEAAWKRDQVLLESARLRLLTGWGRTIAARTNIDQFVHSLAALETAVVRLDVPLGTANEQEPSGARIALLADEAHPKAAQYLGPVSSADAQSQGRGFLFLLEGGALPANAAVIGWLQMSGPAETGVLVPDGAVVRHEGEACVYIQAAENLFGRKQVELERPLTNGWFAAGELRPGEKIVTAGAQQLLSEEFKAQSMEE